MPKTNTKAKKINSKGRGNRKGAAIKGDNRSQVTSSDLSVKAAETIAEDSVILEPEGAEMASSPKSGADHSKKTRPFRKIVPIKGSKSATIGPGACPAPGKSPPPPV